MPSIQQKQADYFVIDPEIVEFVPQILADFDELGSEPERIADWFEDLELSRRAFRVLDLGCGKGAVAIALAKRFGCQVHGVDMVGHFVNEAREKAKAAGVQNLCTFAVGDIVEVAADVAARGAEYDAVLLVSVGDVFGDKMSTMRALRACVRSGGHIVIDDAYLKPGVSVNFPGYEHASTRQETIAHLTAFGDELIREHQISPDEMRAQNDRYTAMIARRILELKQKHPEHKAALEHYLEREKEESRLLETDMRCATWLIRVR